MKKVKFWFVLLLIFLAGCISYNPNQLGNYYEHSSKLSNNGEANIYIYNPHSMSGDSPVVCIDNKKVAELPSNTFTQVHASPGKHSFGFAIDYLWGTRINNTNSFSFSANETYYVKYNYIPSTMPSQFTDANSNVSTTVISYPDNQKYVLFGNDRKASGIFMCRFISPLIDKI